MKSLKMNKNGSYIMEILQWHLQYVSSVFQVLLSRLLGGLA